MEEFLFAGMYSLQGIDFNPTPAAIMNSLTIQER